MFMFYEYNAVSLFLYLELELCSILDTLRWNPRDAEMVAQGVSSI